MSGEQRPIRIASHESDSHFWESVFCAPDARLQSELVGSYQGWTENATVTVRRREIPKVMVPLILNLGADFGVDSSGRGDSAAMQKFGSFAAGLHDRYAVVESAGSSRCIQVNLKPLSARRILGCSMGDLANQVVDLEDLLGAEFKSLLAQMAEVDGWLDRFSLLESYLGARLANAPENHPEVLWAMRRLRRSGGTARIGDIAAEIGCSRKRLIALFRDQVGQTPKTVARIFRFNRVVRLLGADNAMGWAELAHDGGYYDQAHFNRDFRDFAGFTPSEYLGRQLPEGGGTRNV